MSDFIKHDVEKPRADLLPPIALEHVARVLTYGAQKYARWNWRLIDDRSRYHASALRHLLAYARGEDVDPESGELHLAHAACSALFLLEAYVMDLGDDGRPVFSRKTGVGG